MTKKFNKIFYGTLLIIGFIWVINNFFNYQFSHQDLKEKIGVLSRAPEFDKGRGDAPYLRITLKNNNSKFLIDGASYKALDKEAVKSNLSQGDTVTMLVVKETGLNEYLDSFVNAVDVYGLKFNNRTLLTIDSFNSEAKVIRFIFIGIWFIFLGLYIYTNWYTNKSKS